MRTPPARALHRTVGNEGDLAEPGVYCGGVQEVGDERGAAHARRVRVSRSYTEILADRLSFPLSQNVEDAPERDADPVRAVVQFVTELMESLLDGEEFDQGSRVLLVLGIGGGTAGTFGVPIKEGPRRAFLQQPGPLLEHFGPLGSEVHQGRPDGVVERAEHTGHVAQRRVLLASLGEGPVLLALEVYDLEIVADHEDLLETVIPVMPGFYDPDSSYRDVPYAARQLPAQRQKAVRVGAHLLRQPVPALPQQIQRAPALHEYALGPAGNLFQGSGLGCERLVVRGLGECCVKPARTQPQYAHQASEKGVLGRQGLPLVFLAVG